MHACDPNTSHHAGEEGQCCEWYGPCPINIGDCDNDNECAGTLECNQKNKGHDYGYTNKYLDLCGVPISMYNISFVVVVIFANVLSPSEFFVTLAISQ